MIWVTLINNLNIDFRKQVPVECRHDFVTAHALHNALDAVVDWAIRYA